MGVELRQRPNTDTLLSVIPQFLNWWWHSSNSEQKKKAEEFATDTRPGFSRQLDYTLRASSIWRKYANKTLLRYTIVIRACTLFQYTTMGEDSMLFNDFRKSFDYGSHIEVTFNDGDMIVGLVVDIDAETETSDAEISLSLDDGGYINFNISDISSAISA